MTNKIEVGDKVFVVNDDFGASKYFKKGDILVAQYVNAYGVSVSLVDHNVTLGGYPSNVSRNSWGIERFRKATPSEVEGLVIGKEYVVTNTTDYFNGFEKGDVVTFYKDDGTSIPLFKRVSDDKTQYLHFTQIEEYIPTPAQMKGLVIGKKYVVKDASGSCFNEGDVVTFNSDDKSIMPQFKRVSDDVEQFLYVDDVEEYVPTPADKAGLVVGEKYEVIANVGPNGKYFRTGEIVIFSKDDGSISPKFTYTKREDQYENTERAWYMNVEKVKPYVEPPKTPAQKAGLVIGQQYYISEDSDSSSAGKVVFFVEDDGTSSPYFGDEKDDPEYAPYIEDVLPVSEAPVKNTTINFDKVLTEKQIAAILTLVA